MPESLRFSSEFHSNLRCGFSHRHATLRLRLVMYLLGWESRIVNNNVLAGGPKKLVICPHDGCCASVREDRIQRHISKVHATRNLRDTRSSLPKQFDGLTSPSNSVADLCAHPGNAGAYLAHPDWLAAAQLERVHCPFCDGRFLGTHIWAHLRAIHGKSSLAAEFQRAYGALPDGPRLPTPRIGPGAIRAGVSGTAKSPNWPDIGTRTGFRYGARVRQGGLCNGR